MGLTLTDAKRELLAYLEDDPSHGYKIAKDLGKQGPTVYKHLHELEDAGYVEGEESGRKLVYSLTEKGEAIVAAERG